MVVFVGCGVETDSSGTPTSTTPVVVDDNNGTDIVDDNNVTDVVDDNNVTDIVDDDPVVVPDDGDTEDPESVFDTTGAVYDANACLNAYATASLLSDHNENDDDASSDDLNGIAVLSYYTETGNIEDSLVTVYYKKITGVAGDPAYRKNGYFDNSNFNIEYDLVWLTEPNNTIYVKTPKLDNELNSCYKIVLNSNIGSSLSETKVFRY